MFVKSLVYFGVVSSQLLKSGYNHESGYLLYARDPESTLSFPYVALTQSRLALSKQVHSVHSEHRNFIYVLTRQWMCTQVTFTKQ